MLPYSAKSASGGGSSALQVVQDFVAPATRLSRLQAFPDSSVYSLVIPAVPVQPHNYESEACQRAARQQQALGEGGNRQIAKA